ncbi:MAG: restriction endonuclease subunit S [Candidatus Thermoplasmatota archaeon]|nr:restriction endonuclease subunit S [Candidatus Thermoplasmatota archaeon]
MAWRGAVPEGWEIKALKRTFKTLNGSTPKSRESDYWGGVIPWATPDDLGRLKDNTLRATQRMITIEGYNSCGTSMAPSGSLVLSTRAPIGHLAIAGTDMCTNQGCRCLIFRADDDRHFFYYQLLAARLELESLGQGSTFKELGRGNLEGVYLATPSISEQRAIAAFLDRETGRIDALIAKKERQIELLQEKRTALISHAVTKGLDPDAPMKDSGVEWLGAVPEHWVTWKITHGFQWLGSGTTPKSDDLHYYNGKIPWVTTSELRETVIADTNSKLTEKALKDYSSLHIYPPETLLFAMYGATIGRMGILGIHATVNQACCAFSGSKSLDPKFTFYWLWMRRPVLITLSAGGGQPNLSQNDLRNIQIPAPTLHKQRAITTFLDHETGHIDILTTKVHESISKLREYRTALISAAVTGKIDVREELVS